MSESSKPIEKSDDSAKEFIKRSLKGDNTQGSDHDSVYYVQGHYYLFEYLKCESDKATPYSSSPKRYPYNWRKFYSLWHAAKKLDAYLLLVNYSEREADKDQVKVMHVKKFKYNELEKYLEKEREKTPVKFCDYLYMKEYELTFEQYSNYLRNINEMATLPIELPESLPELVLEAVNSSYEVVCNQPILPEGEWITAKWKK